MSVHVKEHTLVKWTRLAHSRKVINKKEMREAVRELLPDFRYVPKKAANDKHRIIEQNSTIESGTLFESSTNRNMLLEMLDYISPSAKILNTGQSKTDYFREHKAHAESKINDALSEFRSKVGDEFQVELVYVNGEYKIALI